MNSLKDFIYVGTVIDKLGYLSVAIIFGTLKILLNSFVKLSVHSLSLTVDKIS
jgi:hypothetical protein